MRSSTRASDMTAPKGRALAVRHGATLLRRDGFDHAKIWFLRRSRRVKFVFLRHCASSGGSGGSSGKRMPTFFIMALKSIFRRWPSVRPNAAGGFDDVRFRRWTRRHRAFGFDGRGHKWRFAITAARSCHRINVRKNAHPSRHKASHLPRIGHETPELPLQRGRACNRKNLAPCS